MNNELHDVGRARHGDEPRRHPRPILDQRRDVVREPRGAAYGALAKVDVQRVERQDDAEDEGVDLAQRERKFDHAHAFQGVDRPGEDEEVASDDENEEVQRELAEDEKCQRQKGGQQFVAEGVEEHPGLADRVSLAGDVAVEEVGRVGDEDEDECDEVADGILQEQDDKSGNDERDARERNDVGDGPEVFEDVSFEHFLRFHFASTSCGALVRSVNWRAVLPKTGASSSRSVPVISGKA